MNSHSFYIQEALKEAKVGFDLDEVPVGAVIVRHNHIISRAHNEKEMTGKVSSHAELLAIERAIEYLGDWRLSECVLYTTLEPCPMCAGAILQSRLEEVVYAAHDLKWGAAGTKVDLFSDKLFNHMTKATYCSVDEASQILSAFFKGKRV